MGVCLFAMFEPQIAGADTFSTVTDGKSVAGATQFLDESCLEKGLKPFTRFIPDFDELAKLAMRSSEAASLVETMFDSGDGLKTVSTLIKALKSEEKWARSDQKGN